MLFDATVQSIDPSNYLIYFMSEFVNFIFCSLIIFILYLKKNLSGSESIIWLAGFALIIPINFITTSYNLFPDANGYLICLRDLRENFLFEKDECIINMTGSLIAGSSDEAIGIFSLKRQIPALFYFLIPIPSIANLSSIGYINKIIFLGLYLFLKSRLTYENLKLPLLVIFFLPTIILYSSIGIRDNIIFCVSLILLVFILERKFLLSIIFLVLLSVIKLQNALIMLIPLTAIFLFKAYKNNLNFLIFLFSLFLTIIVFQEFITEVINYFRLAFLNEVGLISPYLAFEGYQSIWSIILNSPISFIKGIFAPMPSNPLTLLFFLESILIIFIIIFISKELRFDVKSRLNFLIILLTVFSGIVLNVFVIENDFTLLRYKYVFTYILLIYSLLLLNSQKGIDQHE